MILGNPTATAVACGGDCVVRGPGTITTALGGVAGAKSVTIENSVTILSNVEEGVVAFGSVDVRDSVVRLNRIGIDAINGRAVLYRSDVSDNRSSGLLANRAAKIVDSTVSRNGSIGVVSFEGRRITLRDSLVANNGFNGLIAFFGDVKVSGSTIRNSGRSGISGMHVSVRDSVVSDNNGDGVDVIVTRVVGSTLTGNRLAGASALDGTLTAIGVTAQGNGNAGLYADGPFAGTCGLRVVDSILSDNDNDPECGVTMGCADLVSCRAPSVRGDTTCATSYRSGSGIPGESWGACSLD